MDSESQVLRQRLRFREHPGYPASFRVAGFLAAVPAAFHEVLLYEALLLRQVLFVLAVVVLLVESPVRQVQVLLLWPCRGVVKSMAVDFASLVFCTVAPVPPSVYVWGPSAKRWPDNPDTGNPQIPRQDICKLRVLGCDRCGPWDGYAGSLGIQSLSASPLT